MNNLLLSVHHVGGRRGTSALRSNVFQKDCMWTFYDADESCLDQIRANAHGSMVRVLPYCLYSKKCDVEFNINVDPSTNSIFDLNSKYAEFYLDNDYPLYGPMDYNLKDTIKTVRKVKMECTSLDLLSKETEFIGPDILSIDAQGAAYEVIEGSVENLLSKTVAVCCEAEFIPFYKGQKLFSHISQLLEENGFIFSSFVRECHSSQLIQAIKVIYNFDLIFVPCGCRDGNNKLFRIAFNTK